MIEVNSVSYTQDKEALGIQDNFIHESTKWSILSSKALERGEKVKFNNISCIVTGINIEVYKEEIRTIYMLEIKRGVKTAYKTNSKIAGMGLPAIVKDVQGNRMHVHFKIDKEDESCSNEKFFTYAIESSAWYCMPEAGSEVCFENEAVAIKSQ
ncbi:MAG TPA: hypothetical protein DG753_13570 [Clostridium sp.]|nr:hypothetical protein [Clostridium sp.]